MKQVDVALMAWAWFGVWLPVFLPKPKNRHEALFYLIISVPLGWALFIFVSIQIWFGKVKS